LRYLTEINERTVEVPGEFLENPEVKKAVEVLEESAFTPAQLLGYEKFWDAISVERTLFGSGERKGRAEGLAKGRAEGLAEGVAKGIQEGERKRQLEIARNMKSLGVDYELIVKATGLSSDEIMQL